jgi:hypothetical protein
MSEEMQKVADIHQPSRADLKRARIWQERRQRKMNEGVPEDMVDQVLAREDYDRLPVEEKLRRHESFVAGGIERLAQEMTNLHHNDSVLAEAMDMNFKAMSKMLEKLGIPREEQQVFMQQAIEEVTKEREERQAAHAAEATRVAEARARQAAAAGVNAGGDASPPPEATSFGG